LHANLIRGKFGLCITIFVLFFFAALFPSRNHWDTVEILKLAREGGSMDQWTALYFRFLQILSINGKYAFIPAFVGLLSLGLAIIFFINSFSLSQRIKNIVVICVFATPFFGVFGMTLTHEVQTVTGTLFLTGIIIRRIYYPEMQSNKGLVSLSFLFCGMTFVGILIILGYLVASVNKKNAARSFFIAIAIVIVNVSSSALLHVTEVNSATKLQAVLGDMKCVAQHPDAVLTYAQWDRLIEYAPEKQWKEPNTCSDASRSLFVAPKIPGNELKVIRLWLELARQNPQIVLQARIQRAAMALPPPFFQSQPNFSSRNYLEPVGQGTQDDLQQWSPLFKTSNDDPYQKERFSQPSFLKPLEYLVLLPAFILNGQSWFWGWGGMWFVIFLFLLITRTKFSYKNIFRISLPHVFTIIGLFVGSPISDPRYAMTLTMTGFITSIVFLVEYLTRRKILSN